MQTENLRAITAALSLLKLLTGAFLRKGDVALDPFPTLLAAQMMQRQWLGIELDEAYCNLALQQF